MQRRESTRFAARYAMAAASLVALAALAGCGKGPADPENPISAPVKTKPLVTVNSDVIDSAAVESRRKQLRALRLAQGVAHAGNVHRSDPDVPEILRQLVDQALLDQEASRQSITIAANDVMVQVQRLKGQLPKSLTWEQYLNVAELTEEQFADKLHRELCRQRVLGQGALVTDDANEHDLRAYYKQNLGQPVTSHPASAEVRHILIATGENTDPATRDEKRARAQAAHRQLVDGADFAELARKLSDGPNRERGGDMGTVSRGQLIGPVEDAIFNQEIGAVGPVVETPLGFHILLVSARREAQQASFEEVREHLYRILRSHKQAAAIARFMQDLRGRATIVYADPSLEKKT